MEEIPDIQSADPPISTWSHPPNQPAKHADGNILPTSLHYKFMWVALWVLASYEGSATTAKRTSSTRAQELFVGLGCRFKLIWMKRPLLKYAGQPVSKLAGQRLSFKSEVALNISEAVREGLFWTGCRDQGAQSQADNYTAEKGMWVVAQGLKWNVDAAGWWLVVARVARTLSEIWLSS